MNLTNSFNDIEIKYLPALEAFFKKHWGETRLWSHDLSHHRRVWNYAKELLQNPGSEELVENPVFTEKLLIACLLHDIGIAKDSGSRHGKHSMELCKKFLNENKLHKTDFTDLLFAIEKHDEKEYIKSFTDNQLLKMLSVADDLDAFGYIGIYRYLEIYLIRGIHSEVLGRKILDNARKRFENYEKTIGFTSDAAGKHRKRFNILMDFFNGYNIQILDRQIDDQDYNGFPGVVRLISDYLMKLRTFNELQLAGCKMVDAPVIHEFFENLGSEINS